MNTMTILYKAMKKQKNLKDKEPQVQSMKYSEVMAMLEEQLTSKGLRISTRDLAEKKSPDPTINITFINRSKKD
jgi:hypothetical protein